MIDIKTKTPLAIIALVHLLILFSCASSKKNAISKQENFIESHPNWRGHNFRFNNTKLDTDIFELIKVFKQEEKIKNVQDSIILKMKKKNNFNIYIPRVFYE